MRTHGKYGTGAHEQGHAFERRIGFDFLSACRRFAGPEVIPGSGSRQIDVALCRVGFEHRVDQDGRTEHELVAEVPGLRIRAPVHHERALDGVVLVRYLPGHRIDIRHEPVAEAIVIDQNGFDSVKAPQLVVRPMPVRSEDGTERAVFKPARVEFLECGVCERIVMRRPVTANVGGPIRITRQSEIETCRDLVVQAPIGAVDITRPDGGTNALLAEERRARK